MGLPAIPLSRAELGRATWKYFHTVMARFPEKPTQDEQDALRSYIHLFARLYPWYDHDPTFRFPFFAPSIQGGLLSLPPHRVTYNKVK